jgi:hypothetical protein
LATALTPTRTQVDYAIARRVDLTLGGKIIDCFLDFSWGRLAGDRKATVDDAFN